jgi:hypothetical protein
MFGLRLELSLPWRRLSRSYGKFGLIEIAAGKQVKLGWRKCLKLIPVENQLFEIVSINLVDRYRSVIVKLSLIDLVDIRWNEPSDLMSTWPRSKEGNKKY